jgi:hypothetical protein
VLKSAESTTRKIFEALSNLKKFGYLVDGYAGTLVMVTLLLATTLELKAEVE